MTDDACRTVEFDIRGQLCPSTLLVALREMNRYFTELNTGELQLMFLTDNREAVNTIPVSASNMGLGCSVEKYQSGYIIVIFK